MTQILRDSSQHDLNIASNDLSLSTASILDLTHILVSLSTSLVTWAIYLLPNPLHYLTKIFMFSLPHNVIISFMFTSSITSLVMFMTHCLLCCLSYLKLAKQPLRKGMHFMTFYLDTDRHLWLVFIGKWSLLDVLENLYEISGDKDRMAEGCPNQPGIINIDLEYYIHSFMSVCLISFWGLCSAHDLILGCLTSLQRSHVLFASFWTHQQRASCTLPNFVNWTWCIGLFIDHSSVIITQWQ